MFSPSLLNTARVGFSRGSYFFTGETPVDVPGWVAGDPIGAVVIGGGTAVNAASSITVRGHERRQQSRTPCAICSLTTTMSGTSTRIHQIEAGVWLQRVQANDLLAQDQYGQASFGSLPPSCKARSRRLR